MTSRPVRLRPSITTPNGKSDTDGIPEVKRRRLINSSHGTAGGNGNGGNSTIGTLTRSGNMGIRTRGMVESSAANEIEDQSASRVPNSREDGGELEAETKVDETSSDSSSEEDTSYSSDSEDSSSFDESECDRKKEQLLADLHETVKDFDYVREWLFSERYGWVEYRFEAIKAGTAKQFLDNLERLQDKMKDRVEVASSSKDLRSKNLRHCINSDGLSAKQTVENDKGLLKDSIRLNLVEKIGRLEQERNNDFSSELWIGNAKRKINGTSSKDPFGEKKKKAAVISGPYIVYQLHEVDIMEDWTAIKKAALAAPRRKPFGEPVMAY